MALLAYQLNHYLGHLEDSLFNWILPILDNYEVPEKDHKAIMAYHTLAKIPLNQRLALRRKSLKPGKGPKPVTYSLYLLDSNLSNVSLFSSNYQNQVFRIKEQLDVFNQQVHFSLEQFDKTWDPTLSRDAVEKSLDESYEILADRAKWVVEAIDDLEST